MPRKKKLNPSDSMSIFFILDGSGSMAHVQDEVVDGVNSFVAEQQKNSSGTVFSLTVFDGRVEKVYEATPIADVKTLTRSDTLLGGGTALLDAVGKTLTDAENANFTGKKLVVIYTDGYENASKEFKNDDIKKLTKRLEDQGDWTFVYMSADVDNFANAQAIGVSAGNYVLTANSTTSGNFANLSRSASAHASSGQRMSNTFAKDYGVNEKNIKLLDEQIKAAKIDTGSPTNSGNSTSQNDTY